MKMVIITAMGTVSCSKQCEMLLGSECYRGNNNVEDDNDTSGASGMAMTMAQQPELLRQWTMTKYLDCTDKYTNIFLGASADGTNYQMRHGRNPPNKSKMVRHSLGAVMQWRMMTSQCWEDSSHEAHKGLRGMA